VSSPLSCAERMAADQEEREMAAGNTFGATALSSYGGFWISLAIILTPGGFEIMDSYADPTHFSYEFSFFLFVWPPLAPLPSIPTLTQHRAGSSSPS